MLSFRSIMVILLLALAAGFSTKTRRGFVAGLLSTATLGASGVPPALAEETESVYMGVGCFWHIQHEFVVAEREFLGRSDAQLTSKTGYAGGTSVGQQGKVCYHNMQSVADYGKLGHSEVVGMELPKSKVEDFFKFYLGLYDPKTKDRVDPGDKGPEYRSLIGLPGGTTHPLYPRLEGIANASGFKLLPGKGSDPDTLRQQFIYVYDTAAYPFHQAEVYHQFHNDFQSPPYGKDYNKLADMAFDDGRIQSTGCPDRV